MSDDPTVLRDRVDQQLSLVDSLIALPFPEEESRPGADSRWSGPGYHLAVLRESQDFWEGRSPEIVEPAERELEADLAALSVILTERWGAPETVDLWPHPGFDDGADAHADTTAPEPLGVLRHVAASMHLWRLPGSGRWLGLTVGQADPEWQFQLLAGVGEESSLRKLMGAS